MKNLILSFIFLFKGVLLLSQISVSGYITDANTGESLIGATIYDASTARGAASNAFGFFSLNLPKSNGLKNIRFSFIGYKPQELEIRCSNDTVLKIALVPGNNIGEVTVSAESKIEETCEISINKISAKTISLLPAIGGESDVLKVMQLMPGVTQGNELSAGLYVRGGTPDQNLMLIDDVPAYYVNHLGGFVSTFNVDAINSITLIKGGFPAKYGSRVSSVVDIRLKDGNNQKFEGSGSLGLISSKACLQGPIVKSKASYLISFRRMYLDLLTRPLTKLIFSGVSIGYDFYDLNAKINYQINDNNKCYISFYSGDDCLLFKLKSKSIDYVEKETFKWGNNIGSFRWNHAFSPKLFTNTTAGYTRYRYQLKDNYDDDSTSTTQSKDSSIRDYLVKSDWDYYPYDFYTFSFGAAYTNHLFIPINTTYEGYDNSSTASKYNNAKYHSSEMALYLENKLTLFNTIKTNLSARYAIYNVDSSNFKSFEPRLTMNIPLMPSYSVKFGYAAMKQYVHLLTSTSGDFPVDYWVPATAYLKPETSEQYNIGLFHTSADSKYEISIEAYYKNMDNLIAFKDGTSSLSGVSNWESKIYSSGVGISKGLEFMLKKNKGKYTGWINYTLANTTRQFDQINNGNTYPFKYDRRHCIDIVAMYKINQKIDISATWVYQSGSPYTLAYAAYQSVDDNNELITAYIYSDRNAYRMRDYHKLDVGINFRKDKPWGERIWNISVYNLYNRQNPYYYYWQTTDEFSGDNIIPKLKQASLFCFIPSFSYTLKF